MKTIMRFVTDYVNSVQQFSMLTFSTSSLSKELKPISWDKRETNLDYPAWYADSNFQKAK